MPLFERLLLVVFSMACTAPAVLAGGGAASDGMREPPTEEPAAAGWPAGPYARTDALTLTVLGFGALHHVDHVLRDNHSGWPFESEVTAFTYSLAIYPLVGAAYLADAGPLTFVAIDAAGSIGLVLAHTLLEPPGDQYDPWTDGSNVLGIRSPALGRLSQAVSAGLSLSLAAHLVSSVLDGRRHGFTWTRPDSGGRARLGKARHPVSVRGGGRTMSLVVRL